MHASTDVRSQNPSPSQEHVHRLLEVSWCVFLCVCVRWMSCMKRWLTQFSSLGLLTLQLSVTNQSEQSTTHSAYDWYSIFVLNLYFNSLFLCRTRDSKPCCVCFSNGLVCLVNTYLMCSNCQSYCWLLQIFPKYLKCIQIVIGWGDQIKWKLEESLFSHGLL